MSNTDKVLSALLNLAKELLILHDGNLREFDRDPPFLKPQTITAAKSHKEFIQALEVDSDLKILFPDDDEKKKRIRTFRPKTLAGRLINSALWHAAHNSEFNFHRIEDVLNNHLSDLRRLANGKLIRVPTWVFFGNTLPDNTVVHTKIGTLRNWIESDRYFESIPEEQHIAGGMVFTTWTEESHDISSSANVQTKGPASQLNPEIVRLAIALSQNTYSPEPVTPWMLCLGQTLGAGTSTVERSYFRKGKQIENPKQIGEWIDRIIDSHLSSLVIHRTNSMIDRRYDRRNALSRWSTDMDTIIDGVIVWEALFSVDRRTELAFRVSLNMSLVLENTIERQLETRGELNDLYSYRSKIVHGSKVPDIGANSRAAKRVFELTIKAIKRLLTNHINLVGSKNVDDYLRLISKN